MRKTGYDMLYLCRCVMNGVRPEDTRAVETNLDKLFEMSRFHSLTAMVSVGLESVGISDKRFAEEMAKSIRKNILLQSELTKICGFMERAGIWHMPLKGAVLKDMYPAVGLRQMSDNDVLYDGNFQNELAEFMKSEGYTAESVGKDNHDVFTKPPVLNFEMHRQLFGFASEETVRNYYENIRDRLVNEEGGEYAYRFTDEDFYIYMIAHEHKHYSIGGTGLRSLLDCVVYLRNKTKLDWDYIRRETEKLGISDFEEKSRRLAEKIFSADNEELSDSEKEMLEFFLFSGAYGTVGNAVEKKVDRYFRNEEKPSESGYILKRIFPPMDFYKARYPFFYKHRILLPAAWFHRLGRSLTVNHRRTSLELKELKKHR